MEENSAASCAYIGLGHMGRPVFEATHKYFVANRWRVTAVDRDPAKLSEVTIQKAAQPPRRTNLIVVGVRPQDFSNLREETSSAEVVISMMAGVPCSDLQSAFPSAQIIRIIPNTPCEFGSGLTPIYIDQQYSNVQYLNEILTAFGCMGTLLHVDSEAMIDSATGVSAGGPAYIMVIADAMIKAALNMGFSYSDARLMVAHTLRGSADLLLRTDKTPELLAQEIMTPNGTTERGVSTLLARGVKEAIEEALMHASNRASDLAIQANRSK